MLPSILLWLRKFLMPLTDVFNLSCPKVITKISVKNLEKFMQVTKNHRDCSFFNF